MKNKIYKIYSLNCPNTNDVRYIGVTTNSLKRRLIQHLYEGNNSKSNTHKINWLRKLINNNQKPTICLIEITDENNWEEREKYWISKYSNLTNIHEGGSHVYLKPKNNSSKKTKVYQYDLEGNFITSYSSQTEAAKAVGVTVSSLNRSVKGEKASCGGYQWSFVKFENIGKYIKESSTPIKVFKLVPVEYKEFESITKLCQELNIGYNSVIEAINNNRSCKNFMFKKVKI